MQASLFSGNPVKSTPPLDGKPASRAQKVLKKKRKRKATTKVSRGNKLKRHPTRPPAKKRVVKTKKVAMQGHEDGPLGDIVDRDGDTLYIQWPGKDRLMSHNARYMVSVEATDED